jgi:hypothetical protein
MKGNGGISAAVAIRGLKMKAVKFLAVTLVGLGAAMASGAASASGIDFSASNGPLAGSTVYGFNNQTLGAEGTTLNVGGNSLVLDGSSQVVNGTTGNYAAPWNPATNAADTNNYISVYGGGTATFTLASPAQYVGLLWGSVDSYNTLELVTTTGTYSYTGSQVIADADGYQGSGGSIYANFESTSPITEVIFQSSTNSFEFDNLAVVSSVPLPAALPLLGSTLLGVGAIGRWRKRRQAAAN